MKKIVFVIDMINGFVKEGAMHDKKIMHIVPAIKKLLNEKDVSSVFVRDSHDREDIEFKSFPPHCLTDTSESQIIEELRPYVRSTLFKHSTNAFHNLAKAYTTEINDEFILCGCCTDICVMQFALSLKTYLNENGIDKPVIVMKDCVATYDSEDHPAERYQEIALDLMKRAGIEIR